MKTIAGSKSGAEATALQTLARRLSGIEAREAEAESVSLPFGILDGAFSIP